MAWKPDEEYVDVDSEDVEVMDVDDMGYDASDYEVTATRREVEVSFLVRAAFNVVEPPRRSDDEVKADVQHAMMRALTSHRKLRPIAVDIREADEVEDEG